MSDSVLYNGNLFQVVNRKAKKSVNINNCNFDIDLNYELIRRPPGVRSIIVKENKILLNKEFRYEKNDWDYRLPGGKVFDTLEDYKTAINNDSLIINIQKTLYQELLEEANIIPKKFDFFYKSLCGFTVEWDIYYFVVPEFEELETSNDLSVRKNEFEFIEHCWLDYKQAFRYCIDGRISEERSANALIRFLYSKVE